MTNRVLRVPARVWASSLLLALLSVGGHGGRALAQNSDPFYISLLQSGELQYDQGHAAAAAKDLRVACFGMLDQPPLLARCLVRLAVAQGDTGDADGFRETFTRLVDLENRGPEYARADIPAAIREHFELQVVQRIPAATLAANATFQALATKKPDASKKKGRHEREPAPATVTAPATAPVTLAAPPATPKAPPIAAPAPPPVNPAPPTPPAPQPKPPKPVKPSTPEPSHATHSAPPAPPPTKATEPIAATEQAALAAARAQLASAKTAADLHTVGLTVQAIADAHPSAVDAAALAGEIAYRSSRWAEAATYLRRAGPPADQPVLGFYLAVALFETGDRQAAAATLRPLLGKLQRTPYVEGYVTKILPSPGSKP